MRKGRKKNRRLDQEKRVKALTGDDGDECRSRCNSTLGVARTLPPVRGNRCGRVDVWPWDVDLNKVDWDELGGIEGSG